MWTDNFFEDTKFCSKCQISLKMLLNFIQTDFFLKIIPNFVQNANGNMEQRKSQFLFKMKNFVKNANGSTHRWASGGGGGGVRGGGLPRLKIFLWPPSKIQNDPHPLRNGFWPPVRFLSWRKKRHKKKIPQKKKILAGLRRHQFFAKEGQNSHKNFYRGTPLTPSVSIFLWPPSSKKIFWPPSRNGDLAQLWLNISNPKKNGRENVLKFCPDSPNFVQRNFIKLNQIRQAVDKFFVAFEWNFILQSTCSMYYFEPAKL